MKNVGKDLENQHSTGCNRKLTGYFAVITGKTTLLKELFTGNPEVLRLNGDEPDTRALFPGGSYLLNIGSSIDKFL